MAWVVGAMIVKDKPPVLFADFDHAIHMKFPNDRTYMLSIDQSSECTGIYMTDTKQSFHFICDFKKGSEEKHRFYHQLKLFLMRMLSDITLGLFVMEDIPPVKWKNAGNVLRELKGMIQSWKYEIPALTNLPDDRMVKIFPQSWKSKVVDKSKGPNRSNNKREVALDICDIYPELRAHFYRCPSKDYDSFDAVGIMTGYLRANFTKDGQQIGGAKDYYGHINVYYKLLTKEEVDNAEKLIEYFEAQHYNYKAKVLKQNTNYSWYNNIKMAASSYPFVITPIDDTLTALAIRWHFDKDLDGKTLVAYILRKNIIQRNQLDYFKERMMCEELT